MISAAAVVVCALELLGREASTLPPIELIGVAPPGASKTVEAYVRGGSDVISLLTTSDVFETARESDCTQKEALLKLASIIVHEEWHVLHGSDERGAYDAQLRALLRLGVAPDSRLYVGVVRAMLVACARA